MSSIDLHMHSYFSDDGDYFPEQLAGLAISNEVKLLAITDHNNIQGIGRLLQYCKSKEVEAISGIEIDCVYCGTGLHVLGYGVDHSDPVYGELWQDVLNKQQKASAEQVKLVRSLGIEFSDETIASLSKWGIVTGEMIAEAAMLYDFKQQNELLRPYYKGGARSENPFVNFYWDFCSRGKPAYSSIEFMSLEEAVKVIRGTGGIPVLAHPGVNTKENKKLLDAIFACGVDGIEAFSSYHNKQQAQFYDDYAKNNGLLVTCGSDFHGKTKPSVKIGGVCCGSRQEEIAENIRKRLDSLNSV